MTEAIEFIGRVAVVIPTYNEKENIRPITGRVRTAVPGADLLIVDDNSPDGTGQIADELAAADKHVHVLHRPGKAGLGAAYIAGFQAGLDQGYDTIVEMEAPISFSAHAGCPAERHSTGRSHASSSPAQVTLMRA